MVGARRGKVGVKGSLESWIKNEGKDLKGKDKRLICFPSVCVSLCDVRVCYTCASVSVQWQLLLCNTQLTAME